jgi:hypothetical protein
VTICLYQQWKGPPKGTVWATEDADCVPLSTPDNLDRLADALAEFNVRLRVAGMPDDEARALSMIADRRTFTVLDPSTWTTDAARGASVSPAYDSAIVDLPRIASPTNVVVLTR